MRLIALGLAGIALFAHVPPTANAAQEASPGGRRITSMDAPSRTIGILGASVSAGFGMFVEVPDPGAPPVVGVRLADVVQALAPTGTIVSDWSTSMFFRDPCSIGPKAAKRLAEQSPDVVLAIDFLFWFAYGAFDADGSRIADEAQRHDLFERGLSLLETFEVPILVGDLPDMRGASRRMLSERQMPSPRTLARLNARLRQWAAGRESVSILPLEAIRRSQSAAPPERLQRRLQADRLHPTFEGLVAILASAAPTLETLRIVAPDGLEPNEPASLARRIAARILGDHAGDEEPLGASETDDLPDPVAEPPPTPTEDPAPTEPEDTVTAPIASRTTTDRRDRGHRPLLRTRLPEPAPASFDTLAVRKPRAIGACGLAPSA